MLHVNGRASAAAKSYYTKGLSREDAYYTNAQEIAGQWGGKGAERLGLKGEVTSKDFAALCDNIHPHTGERLTVRTKVHRRVGYDITFDAPKSVSVSYAFSRDHRILDAFENAVAFTMVYIEMNMLTRVRKDGRDETRKTGNLVYGKFTHFTARPEHGIPDPQLHQHVFVLNATYDTQEQRWKAGEFGEIKFDAPYYQAVFHNRLAENLRALGFKIRLTQHAFEIEGVPQSVIDEFSKRKARIEKYADDRGIVDPKIKARLWALTREAKRNDLSKDELKELWTIRLSKIPTEHQQTFQARLQSPQPPNEFSPDPEATSKAIRLAREHCFHKFSVVDELHLATVAMKFSVGATSVEKLRHAIADDKTLIHRTLDGRAVVTTPEVLLQEENLVAWVRKGLATCAPLAYGYTPTNPQIDDELRTALRHILESRDRVTGVHGKSGAGKTTLMREAIPAIESRGHRVIVVAPSSEASRKTLRESGFSDANTVARLLQNDVMQRQATGAVWWIDEAGLLSVPEMKRLTDLAEELNARLIFSGDTRQHGSVERGDALRLLQEHAGLEMASLNTIRRQKGTYRDAIDDLAEGRIVEGFEKLDAMGAIREIPSEVRYEYLAKEYIRSIHQNRTALVVSPTHAEGRKVTEQIRRELKETGDLTEEQNLSVLQKIDLSPAQKKDLRLYRAGWVIEMVKAAPCCRTGERLSIVSADEQWLFVRHADGREQTISPTAYGNRFDVYEHATLPVGIGDLVRVTKNGKTQDGRQSLDNGTVVTVTGFTKNGDLSLDTGQTIARHFGHLAHGYVMTSHTAQSKTVQDIYVAESAESFPAADRRQFYVSASRGADKLAVFTDDKEALLLNFE